ncbi:efflux RND transporter periplasmic adaptor subunit [Sphingobium indicum]|uniref:Secretion protein HlyD n=2 Tax=Sphingobium indicum TaxID=332055 RepID=A0A1L5BN53_SPHIB|nr:efflux RND transporter periplasmic adaptor subunit [Sphingobium indicum]APL94207.1 secretion protein HlyD [Sphingobium indicum B90A]NYI21252.1 HlyD family secretion protein [Sphingobium indicum]RYM03948.1 efflux RND transporter periplasmic adaptor subunit [Sphingobium indicum]
MTNDATSDQGLNDFLGERPERPWRKWAVRGAVGVALLILVLLLARCFSGDDKPNYATREVRKGDLTVSVSATGNLKPINQVDVGSEQSGKITAVHVDVNDRVTRGQKLAELDTRRLVDTINQNRAQLASSQAGVAQAEAQAALAKATLDRQLNVFKLSGGRVPARTELDAARADYSSALANLRSAQAQVRVSQAQLSTAQTNLSIAQIVSPVTGVVLSRDIEPGQTVAASLNAPVLFTIAEDLTQMEVEVSVDEADVGQVKEGQSANFSVDAFPGRTFPARVTRVNVGSNSASASSSSSSGSSAASSTTGTVVAYTAVLSVDNKDEILRPGMTATADIVTQELHDVLLVPNSALRFKPSAGNQGGGITSQIVPGPRRFRRGGANRQVSFGIGSSQTVYVVGEDGNPRAVQVTVGASDGARTVITGGGLKPGMRVITGQLAAGQQAPAEDQADGGSRGGGPRDRNRRPEGDRSTDGSPATVGKLGNSGGGKAETAPVRTGRQSGS